MLSLFKKIVRKKQIDQKPDPGLHNLSVEKTGLRTFFHSHMKQVISDNDLQFFIQIKESGVINKLPFIKLFNGDILFGSSDVNKTYYGPIFDAHREIFEKSGIKQEAFPAAFDAMISYHYENCDLLHLRKSCFISKDSVVLDVGTRASQFAVKASRMTGPRGRVIGIDATDFAETFFHHHQDANQLDNLFFAKAIVGDQDGKEAKFFFGSENESFSGIFKETINQEGNKVVNGAVHKGHFTHHMKTIDTIVTDLSLKRCDLVIMQLNGGEALAIEGMKNVMMNYRPVLFISAFQRHQHGENPAIAVKRNLAKHNYKTLYHNDSDYIFVPE